MMLRKLISASLACLLIFSCTAGVLAAPPEQMDPSEAIAPEEAVDSAYTYDENGILTEYVEPIPDLTDEENAYDKLIAFYGAAGLPCDITYENFLDCFAASGLEYIEDYLVQCIDELYETYSLDKDIDSGKAQPVFSQSEQSLEETLQQAYIAVTEYSEYLGMPMMTDFETFCAQYASSGLYDVEVYRDHCKDEIYAAFLRTEEGMVPPEEAGSESGIPATLPGTMTDAMIEGSYDTYSIGDGFKKEYEEVPEDISDEQNAYNKLCAYYKALFSRPWSTTYTEFLNEYNSSSLTTLEAYVVQRIDGFYEQYVDGFDETKGFGQAWYYNTGTTLPRRATYSQYNLLSAVQKGDLLCETRTGLAEYTGHIAIVEGVFWSTTQSQFYIRVIEAIYPGGVCRGVFDETRLADKGDVLLRPKNATGKIVNNALIFAENQIGKDFRFHAGRCTSADKWYCSELAWAAYYNAGLNIDSTYGTGAIMPKMLLGSRNIRTINFTQTKPSARFTDIANHWAYSAISYMLNNGLMSGMTAYKFEPNTNITRAMFVSLLYRLAGRPNVSLSASSSNSFSDVRDQNSYYYYAVAWASSNGIVSGYTDGTFKPDNLVTREQCASFLYRFARYKNLNLNYSNSSLNQFTDVGQVSSYALIPMKWAVSRGIMSGTTTTTLSPQTTCTRAMSAQLLKKLIDTLM